MRNFVMDTIRTRAVRAAVMQDALAIAMRRDIPDSRRDGDWIRSLTAPQHGWFNLGDAEEVRTAAELFGIEPTDQDFEDAFEARTDIPTVIRLALSGWSFHCSGTRVVGSAEIADHHHERATENTCTDPDGETHFRSDIPVHITGQQCLLDETIQATCMIWVWPNGSWEVDVGSVIVDEFMRDPPRTWRGEDITLPRQTRETVELYASQNRDVVQPSNI